MVVSIDAFWKPLKMYKSTVEGLFAECNVMYGEIPMITRTLLENCAGFRLIGGMRVFRGIVRLFSDKTAMTLKKKVLMAVTVNAMLLNSSVKKD